jgi:hypothetical protein
MVKPEGFRNVEGSFAAYKIIKSTSKILNIKPSAVE